MTAAPHRQTFRHPLLALSIAFAGGTVVARVLMPSLTLLLVVALLTTATSVLLRRKQPLSTMALMLSFLLLGAALYIFENGVMPKSRVARLLQERAVQDGEPLELTGKISAAPEPGPELMAIDLQISSMRIKENEIRGTGVVRLYLQIQSSDAREYEELEIRYGARLRVIATLNRAERFQNPGVPSFTEFLERRGYDAVAFVKSPLLIERLEDHPVFLPLAWLYEWRLGLHRKITVTFNETTAGVLCAALLGYRGDLSESVAERFREGGTYHVLVISGLHISFIGAVAYLLTRQITRKRSLQFLISTTLLWGYTLAVGASSSVARAAFMFSFVTFAPIVRRRAASINSMGAAGLVLLALRPGDLFDPSFQLTFLSVAAIILLSWPLIAKMGEIGRWRPTLGKPFAPAKTGSFRDISELLYWSEKSWRKELARTNYTYNLFKNPWAARLERYRVQWILRYAFNAVVISFCVQLTLLPLLILHLHRVSLASLMLNIGVGLLMAALLLMAIMALLLSLISPFLAGLLVHLSNGTTWLMVHSVEPFSVLQIASIRIPDYPGVLRWLYAIYYLPLIVSAFWLSSWDPLGSPDTTGKSRVLSSTFRVSIAAQICMCVILILHPYSAQSTHGRLRVDFLDVGHGDAALVTTPDGTTLLIDGGGRRQFQRQPDRIENEDNRTSSIGEAVVSEFLWSRGLSSVDYVLATHVDADHMEGLNAVIRNFDVRAAFVGRTAPSNREYDRFAHTAASSGTPVFVLKKGDVLQFQAITATVLHPDVGSFRAKSTNDDSVVLSMTFGHHTLLFTGDIEKHAEAILLLYPALLQADLVKVAHHGSRTSSSWPFVRSTGAKFAVISVGKNSVFGHHHREVVERWQAGGAMVLTTGTCGAITAITNGANLTVTTFSAGSDRENVRRCALR